MIRPFTKDEAEAFIKIDFNGTIQESEIPESEIPFLLKVMNGKFTKEGIDAIDFSLRIFISCYLCKTPAHAVMWAYTLIHMLEGAKYEKLTIDIFASDFFPVGVPTDEAYKECWKAQKKIITEEMKDTSFVDDNKMDDWSYWSYTY